ncbi:MAG: ATP synthase F0 subunit B [Nitrospira sp.]|nr:ATP synthase F0 subunit B [Nitrospira sp.]
MKKVQSSKLKVKSKKNFIIFAFCIFNFAFASLVFGATEEAHPSVWKDYFWKIINFGILIAILWIFAKKPFQAFLRQRTEMIQKTLKEAQEAKEAAQKALQEVEEKLRLKDAEIEKILAASRGAGESERLRLIEQGDKLREKILEQAKANIEFELRHAKEAIKAEAVEIAIELAEKKIKEKLTKEEQEKLLEESIAKIGGSK